MDIRKPETFGGVIVDQNQIKNKRVEKNPVFGDTFIIEFKSGVTAQYPMQKGNKTAPALNSNQSNKYKLSGKDAVETEGWNITGLTLEGSKGKVDDIKLHDCNDTLVNTFNDKENDQVYFDGGQNNQHFE